MNDKDKQEREELHIRQAIIDDYKAIADISKNDLGYECDNSSVKTRLSLIDNNRECVYVAEYHNIVIGYVHVERYNTLYCETLANILGLAVASKYQGIGAGRMLMMKAEEWADKIGAFGVRLNSGSSRIKAHEFYRKIGYNQEKEQIRFMKRIKL